MRLRQWISDVWRRERRRRPTTAGLGFALATATVTWVAWSSGNNLLILVAVILLGAMLISGPLGNLSLAGLELDVQFPEHVSARRKVPARMRLRNEKNWMPSFSIHVRGAPGSVYASQLYIPLLAGGTTVEKPVDVYFERRGLHRRNSFQLLSRFPFGFSERQARVTPQREVLVYPSLEPHPRSVSLLRSLGGELAAHVPGRSHDFYRIRPYEALESARHIDWRATAHTSELQVREFAREQEPLVEIFLDLEAPVALRPLFEAAVDCCACLVWEVARKGARLRFRTQEFDLAVPAEGDVYTVLRYLALVEPKAKGALAGPGREDSLKVVLSANPGRFSDAGWEGAHLVAFAEFADRSSESGGWIRRPIDHGGG